MSGRADVAIGHNKHPRLQMSSRSHKSRRMHYGRQAFRRDIRLVKHLLDQIITSYGVNSPHQIIIGVSSQNILHVAGASQHRIAADALFVVVDKTGHLPFEDAMAQTHIFYTGSNHTAIAFAADNQYFFTHILIVLMVSHSFFLQKYCFQRFYKRTFRRVLWNNHLNQNVLCRSKCSLHVIIHSTKTIVFSIPAANRCSVKQSAEYPANNASLRKSSGVPSADKLPAPWW